MNIEWNKVTWYSKLVAVALFVLVFYWGFYLGVQFEQTRLFIEQQPAESQVAALDTTSLRTYNDPVLQLSFQYPSVWGEVEVHGEGNYGRYFSFTEVPQSEDSEYPLIFFSAVNVNGDSPDRGGFWGDISGFINSSASVANYCNEKSDCEVYVNSHGVRIAKEKDFVCTEGGCAPQKTNQYYFYSGQLKYPSVGLSDAVLGDSYSVSAQRAFESLVQSIQLLQ